MYIIENQLEGAFSDEASRRYYSVVLSAWKHKRGDSKKQLEVAFGLDAVKNKADVLHRYKKGKQLTSNEISIAVGAIGLNPNYLFGLTDKPFLSQVNTADSFNAEEGAYDAAYRLDRQSNKRVGKQLKELLERHGVNVKDYAEKQLGITRIMLHKVLAGEVEIPFGLVVKMCEDFSESLDQFRTKPLAQGHYLTKLETMEAQMRTLQDMIDMQKNAIQAKDDLIEMYKKNSATEVARRASA